MKVTMSVIPHSKQHYNTTGDWFFDGKGNLRIYVSKLTDWRYEALIMFHEFIEAILCDHNGISGESVTNFDVQFEYDRKEGNLDEPGDSPDAPYNKQHLMATNLEKQLAIALDVDWKAYEDEVAKVGP